MNSATNTVDAVLDDLVGEQQALDDIVASLTDEQWALPTPSPRWSVADQIGHLTYFDLTASWAIVDEERFTQSLGDLVPALGGELSDEQLDNLTLGELRAMTPTDLLAQWRTNRAALAAAGQTLTEDRRVVWYGPSMGAKSFLTARLMECWAHGQDIVDTVQATRAPTDRLRHIAQLGFITRKWSYVNRGEELPDELVRVELTAPSGATWSYGPDDAAESVTGSALDFCLVVTQRRHLDDTGLAATPVARHWLERAQAFAGGATDGPSPRR